jgi:amino acid adenylation domain-containing protein
MPEDMFERYASLAIELADSDAAWTRRFKDLRPAAHRAEHLAANATQTEWAQPLLLHGMFRSRAISHPEAPAVIDDRITSYGELAAQANAVTVRLRELGVRPGELVAVAMGKGREQVAAVIGILQARAAYLPVSIDLPAARRAFLLADARVRVVLSRTRDQALITTDQAEKSAVGAGEPYRWPTVVTVDDMRPVPELPGDAHAVLQSDLAYIIYTSGSTGQPKGVMIDHAGAANTILDINERFGITASDRAIAVSELNFDLSVYDIFGMLAAGGAIVMPQPGHDADPRHWADLVSRHGVTVWNSVPALMQLLVEHQESRSNSELASLRRVLLSGDWIPVTLPGRVTRQFPAAKVISLGGATEASIWSIFHDVDDSDAKRASIPYGRPLANQAFHVLDECLEARPTWVPGELYIGGAGVALGYWADEQRSTERFIRHPASGERIYRTGDFGRYLPGGEIEFLGRDDSQVKVNGHRVELGEIESTLLQHQEVTAAVAFAPQIDGRRRLVGYVVPATGVPGAGAQAHGSLHRLVRAEAADCAAVWERVTAAADHHVREARMDASMAQFGQFEQAVETLSTAAIRDTLHKLGLFGRSGDHLDLDSVLDAGRVAGRYRRLISQWLAALTDDGVLISDNGGYRAAEPLGPVDLQSRWTAVAAAASWGPHADRLVGYLRQAVDQLVPLLQGDADPLEVLFEGGDLAVADSLYRNNPVLDSCNEIAGKSVDALCAGWTGGRPLRVLELGAGTGGMTASVLPRLLDRPVSYTYTDVSRFLLDRAGERFAKYPFLDFRYLDVNVPPWQQGYQAHDYDVVLAANVLHDAHEVTRSLSWVRELIVPGGVLVMVEGTSNSRLQLVSLGLIEGLSAYQDSRAEGNQPLLNAAEWAANLHAAGFTRTHAVSGSPTAQALQQSVLIAQSPSEAAAFDPQLVRQYLRTQLPDYMIPGTIVRLDALPLSSNGKVRRTELPLPPADTSLRGSRSENSAAPESAVQRIIAAVWQQALAIPEPGLHDSFFALGGDSLVATKVVARLREEFAIELRIREMFDAGTIARLSVLIERRRTAATAAGTGSAVAENDDNEWIEEEI